MPLENALILKLRTPVVPVLVCALAGLAAQAFAQGATQGPADAARANQMSLSASAATEVTLDTLTVTLAVIREGPDASQVQSQLRQALDTAVTEARKAARPKAVEVQTGAFSLSPRYVNPTNRPAAPSIAGWTGRAELLIEGRDLPAVAQLVGRLNTMTVARVGFALSREAREKVEDEVAQQAITRFRARADSYARQFGFAGYQIRDVQVGLQDAPIVMTRAPMMVRAAAAGMADDALPVEAGKTTVSVTVNGTVEMVR